MKIVWNGAYPKIFLTHLEMELQENSFLRITNAIESGNSFVGLFEGFERWENETKNSLYFTNQYFLPPLVNKIKMANLPLIAGQDAQEYLEGIEIFPAGQQFLTNSFFPSQNLKSALIGNLACIDFFNRLIFWGRLNENGEIINNFERKIFKEGEDFIIDSIDLVFQTQISRNLLNSLIFGIFNIGEIFYRPEKNIEIICNFDEDYIRILNFKKILRAGS